MRIGIDAREAFKAHPTGKGMWTKYVIEELRHRKIDLVLFGMNEESTGLLWHLKLARHLRKERPVDLYLSPTSYIVPFLVGRRFPCAVVIHDLIALHHEPHDVKTKLIERLCLPRILKTAHHLFTVSNATKSELFEYFPHIEQSKVTSVYAGPTVEKKYAHVMLSGAQASVQDAQRGVEAPYILSIGTLCPRKNQMRLIQAFTILPDALRKKYKLILAGGRGWQDEKIIELAKKSDNVEWKGYIGGSELQKLLLHTTLLAYPSLYEGFGFPVLDAMTLGIPVLTSRRGSLPEVAGDAALLCEPKEIEDIAKGLELLLTNEKLREELKEKGRRQAEKFSWRKTVDKMIEVFDRT